jgi:hypothetical protein
MPSLPIGVLRLTIDERDTDYIICIPLDRVVAAEARIPAEAVIGACLRPLQEGEDVAPENFAPNSYFIDLLHDVVALRGPWTPHLQELAKGIQNGPVYVIDERTLTPETGVPEEYLIGQFEAKDGQILPGSYQPNEAYCLLTSDGFLELHPELEDHLTEALAAIPNVAMPLNPGRPQNRQN